jgi:hypothetical protein
MQSSNLQILIFAALLGAWFGAALFYVVIVGPLLSKPGHPAWGFYKRSRSATAPVLSTPFWRS